MFEAENPPTASLQATIQSFPSIQDADIFAPTGQSVGCCKNASGEFAMSEAGKKTITAELNQLLDVIWNTEMRVVRKVYVTKRHEVDYPKLTAVLVDGGFGAWACVRRESSRTILVSTGLVERVWADSLRDAVNNQLPRNKKLDNEIKLLDTVRTLPGLGINYNDAIEQNAKFQEYAYAFALAIDAYAISKIASRAYYRALIFILAHETAHYWFDKCEPGSESEIKADDYGLLISTTWAGEQFEYAIKESRRQVAKRDYVLRLKEERLQSRKRLKAAARRREGLGNTDKNQLDAVAGSLQLAEDRELAKLTDKQISHEADELYPRDAMELTHPLGRLGYETIVEVYKAAGFTESDNTHLSLQDRIDRLRRGYEVETLEGATVLKRLFNGSRGLEAVTAQITKSQSDKFLDAMIPSGPISLHPECEIVP
jgi:hypothetical protein